MYKYPHCSRGGTGCPKKVWMLALEVSDELRLQNVASRDTGPLLWSIALPIHEVLNTPALAPGPSAAAGWCREVPHQ